MSHRESYLCSFFLICSALVAVLLLGVQRMQAAPLYACPSGLGATETIVVGNICYAYYSTTLLWSPAEAACETLNGKLAAIRSSEQNAAIQSIITQNAWIGATDSGSLVSGANEGEYFWAGDTQAFWTGGMGGSTVDDAYHNWDIGEPNDMWAGGEDCAHMYTNGTWNDLGCKDSNFNAYVCQVTAVANASSSSTENVSPHAGGLRDISLQARIDQAVQRRNGALTAAVSVSSAKKFVATSTSSMASKKISAQPTSASSVSAKLSSEQRIVLSAILNLRADSRINAGILRVLKQGQKLVLLGVVDKDWAYVRVPNGPEGYVWRKFLGK